MRLILWFIGLLLLGATTSGLLWRSLPAARGGDAGAMASALVPALVAFLAFALLARIVLRIYALRAMRPAAVSAVRHFETNDE